MWKGYETAQHILESYYGLKEIPGKESNPDILKIIQWAIPEAADDSRYAWCAISLSYFINEACGPFDTIKVARHFLKYGFEVENPDYGDIVIFWRGSKSSWKGHVGIVIRVEGDIVWTLGGNQDNQINIKAYSTNRVLGYRRL